VSLIKNGIKDSGIESHEAAKAQSFLGAFVRWFVAKKVDNNFLK